MYPYNGPKLIAQLAKQHAARSQLGLFQQGIFTLPWRTKVGSYNSPDLETMITAGEPCGAWQAKPGCPQDLARPEAKRNVGQNWQNWRELPLNGYVPGTSIRGIVRAWASQFPNLQVRMRELLGYQTEREIVSGKVEFLDAFPTEPTKVSLDIVNPQQDFQVFHQGQSKPLSLYTLGDGSNEAELLVAIRGIPGKATDEEVSEVWGWVQQALKANGIGSRTASGYGVVNPPEDFQGADLPQLPKGHASKRLDFKLYSQGNAGPDMKTVELRPAHWRGWLRSWLLRFFLGVMSESDAKATVGELLGTLEDGANGKSCQGCIRLKLIPGQVWGKPSKEGGYLRFYEWRGSLLLKAPKEILNGVILPIVRIALMVGGVGKGWRRPLHRFCMNNGKEAARGCHLTVTHKVKPNGADQAKNIPYGLALKPEEWQKLYDLWQGQVQAIWPGRFNPQGSGLNAEIFSPKTCAVYLVPGPAELPIDLQDREWTDCRVTETRGQGMDLIYKPAYKRKRDVGGDAGGGNAHCSWVSIKCLEMPSPSKAAKCSEVVCLFMGQGNSLRSKFRKELSGTAEAQHIFGMKP